MGRVFLANIDDPFAVVTATDRARSRGGRAHHPRGLSRRSDLREGGVRLVSSTASVTAVVGTHTHVQTADERMLPGGTAYLTDVGMTGPHDGVIGMERDGVIARFTTGLPARFEPATGDPRLHAVDRHGRSRRPDAPAASSGCRLSARTSTRSRATLDAEPMASIP